jgi:hypothetical protein
MYPYWQRYSSMCILVSLSTIILNTWIFELNGMSDRSVGLVLFLNWLSSCFDNSNGCCSSLTCHCQWRYLDPCFQGKDSSVIDWWSVESNTYHYYYFHYYITVLILRPPHLASKALDCQIEVWYSLIHWWGPGGLTRETVVFHLCGSAGPVQLH